MKQSFFIKLFKDYSLLVLKQAKAQIEQELAITEQIIKFVEGVEIPND